MAQSPSSSRGSPLDQYNPNNTAVKRLMVELKDLKKEPSDQYTALPLTDNLFEWHFTIRGPSQSTFDGGLYHGRILLPFEYPFKPPSIMMLTPNGRFEVNKKICLSISNYHPEYWQPCWSIRTVLVAIRAFMPTKGEGAVGAIDCSDEDRRRLAVESANWSCAKCGSANHEALPPEGSLGIVVRDDPVVDISFGVAPPSPAVSAQSEPAQAPSLDTQPERSSSMTAEPATTPTMGPPLAPDLPESSSSSDSGVAEFVDESLGSFELATPSPPTPVSDETQGGQQPMVSRERPPSRRRSSARQAAKSQQKPSDIVDHILMALAIALIAAIVYLYWQRL